MLNSFDITQDFHSSNTHVRVLIPDSKDVPSSHLWGLFLFAHPESRLFNESPDNRKMLVTEYLKDPTFSFDDYTELIKEIQSKLLTKAQKSLMVWEAKLHERDDYIGSVRYDASTYEMLDKLLEKTSKRWDEYDSIQERLGKEKAKTFGDQEESASEKGLI